MRKEQVQSAYIGAVRSAVPKQLQPLMVTELLKCVNLNRDMLYVLDKAQHA